MVLFSLLVAIPTGYGQRIQLRRKTIQDDSALVEVSNRSDPMLKSRWPSVLRKEYLSRSPLARRTWGPSQREEQRRIVSRPRLAEVIKSREFPSLESEWQSMSVEQDTAALFQVYEQLPDRQFRDVPHATFGNVDSLPVAVRQSQADQQLFFYLANASPWRLRVHLQLDQSVSKETVKEIESLLQSKSKFTSSPDNHKGLIVELAAYDLVGGTAAAFGPIESYTFEYLDDVASDLRKRVFALQVKLQQAQQAKSLPMLSNPEFVASDSVNGPIDGWEIGQQPTSRFKLLNDLKKQTSPAIQKNDPTVSSDLNQVQSYLQVRSVAEETTWVRSQPIKPTETGRLSISVWLRIPDGDGTDVPEIRMAIDGRTPTQEYYRFGAVGRESAESSVSLAGQWKQFAVHFEDLPDSLTDLRIGFDVVGEGVVDIGPVELFDRWFDNGEAKAVTQLLASADAMLRQPAQFDRCRRLLEEHWAVFLDDHFSLTPVVKNAQQPVPMFKPSADAAANVAEATVDKTKDAKQKHAPSKAGPSLNR